MLISAACPQQLVELFDMCDEWCCIGTAALSPPLIVTSPETKGRRSRRRRRRKKTLQHEQ